MTKGISYTDGGRVGIRPRDNFGQAFSLSNDAYVRACGEQNSVAGQGVFFQAVASWNRPRKNWMPPNMAGPQAMIYIPPPDSEAMP